ncbi:pyridoxamine 5'-phosphate oxidase family protein [Catellatospora sp. KI3]|uniref:pyridoxamine 5'-phosphate oxidase family protein n=1 Tax=Catellatospora sp. KI3 TaxID=3041620 RepID=UPI00248275CB|nr:pyridoxamine 5'-phosphate oxidase family protein [Catellatospora sp. KI3]MDI1460585.1 pyridoxamine 5'-phosphate oxidase family protein [Catellatospora sp. KI3]
MGSDKAHYLLNNDPIAKDLLNAAIPVRMAYIGPDGDPRVIPISFIFNGDTFEIFTLPASPKVAALRANPKVALTVDTESQPPRLLMVRGTATLTLVDGIPDDYLDTGRRLLRDSVQYANWEAHVTSLWDQLVRISITPTWAKVFDFGHQAPAAVLDVRKEKGYVH